MTQYGNIHVQSINTDDAHADSVMMVAGTGENMITIILSVHKPHGIFAGITPRVQISGPVRVQLFEMPEVNSPQLID